MNLLSGLDKFGFDAENTNIFEDEKTSAKKEEAGQTQAENVPQETDFLLEKAIRCPVCDGVFKTKMVKNGRLKRLEPDADLRPRFQYIDSLKYDVSSCPKCGYTAMNRYFEHLSQIQIKLIQDNICSKFKPDSIPNPEGLVACDYETALSKYKLALFNSIAKKAKASEKAYTCLKISWLLRGQGESLSGDTDEIKEQKAAIKKEEDAFYVQAYEGFVKAVASELFPMCGMDQNTVDYLMAAMAFHLKKYDVASKTISSILVSRTAPNKIKDKALNMKDEIIAAIKGNTK